MAKNRQPAKAQHGIGAKGQGKATFFQSRIALAIRRSKSRMHSKNGTRSGFRNTDGHWV
jgi:hypothetical protein